MSIVIFWIQRTPSEMFPNFSEPKCRTFDDHLMSEAMEFMRKKRTEDGVSHVGMVNEPEGMVGTKDAGGSVQDGKLPDGTPYTWMKRRSQ